MNLSFDSTTRHISIIGVVFLCSLTLIGCNKKKDETADTSTADAKIEVDKSTTAPVVQCDDQVALTHLIHSVKSTVNSKTKNLFNFYSERAEKDFSAINANTAANSILVDVANPTMLQGPNSQGMVTCKASLSVTLPNKDVNRANKVFAALDSGSLSQVLQEQRITINNNMLVSDSFNYVVGMQGGQSTARVVGKPTILTAAADIIAKSQFQAALEASRPRLAPVPVPATPSVPRVRPAEITPSEARPRSTPSSPAPSESNQGTQSSRNSTPSVPANPEPKPKPTPSAPVESPTPSTANKTNSKPLTTPDDENIEMVIIEEEDTY